MKKKLREEKILERLNHNPLQKTAKDQRILNKIKRLAEFKFANSILIYLPIKGEVDLSKLFKSRNPKKFILPRINSNKLELHYVTNLSETELNKYKIPEPMKNLPFAKAQEIDLAIIPGVVFSQNGHRIGYGKGYFDRLLKKTNCPKIGVAYNFQIVNNIPGESHDVPMDIIITENKTMRINEAKTEKAKTPAKKRTNHKFKNTL